MDVRALFVARCVVAVALFPALAGCASEGEPLDRADRALGGVTRLAEPRWAEADAAEIRPGTMLRMEGGECPIAFVLYRPDNSALFLATTAYCARDLPIGSIALAGEGENIAVLIYSSFQTMHEVGERDEAALEYNDLAIFHLDRSAGPLVSPALPGGGPTELADGGAYAVGDRLRLFSATPRLGAAGEWREGIVAGHAGDWAILTYGVLPGAPGELGGGVLDPEGRAVGMLVTLGVAPNPGANGVARLDTMLAYASEHAKLDVVLATAP